MRPSALLREAWRDVAVGTSRTVVLVAALLLVALAAQVSDLMLTRQYVDEAAAYQAAGASVMTVAAEGRIDGAACARLGELASVRAAGAVRAVESPLVAAALPQSPIPLDEVTAGFPAVLRAEAAPGAGLVLSDEAADAVGIDAGRFGTLPLADGSTASVRGTYGTPDDGRRSGFAFAALAVSTTESPFDECWVDAWPQSTALRAVLLTTVLPGDGGPDQEAPALASLNATLGTVFDGASRNDGRITLGAAPLAGVVAALACWAAAGLRRVELASALHSGVHRVELLSVLLLESLAWILPLAATTTAVALVFSSIGAADDASSTVLQGLRAPALTVGGGLIGVVLGVLSVREKHLFRYFKNR